MDAFWTWLSTPLAKGDVLDPFGLFCVVLLIPGYVISAHLAGPGADRVTSDRVQVAGVRFWATIGLWIFGAGLFFFGTRVMQINPLSFGEPKWLLGSLAAILFAAARCLDWWRKDYPAEPAPRIAAETIAPRPDLGSHVSSAAAGQTIPRTTVRK
jgi:hypothetical protein